MSTLDRDFLASVVMMAGFRGHAMRSAQAALLIIGLRGHDFTGADLPGEITNGSRHLAGAAVGALIASGLVEVVGRIKSPRPEAKGRKLDVLRIPSDRVSTAKTWLRNNDYPLPESPEQLSLLSA